MSSSGFNEQRNIKLSLDVFTSFCIFKHIFLHRSLLESKERFELVQIVLLILAF